VKDLCISVVICAYTEARWDKTLAAVESLRRQTQQCNEIILVVDHNPVLHTRLRKALLDVQVAENAYAPGLSGARNTGISLASSEIVAFLDDDATADANWLKCLSDSYAESSVLAVGGLIDPVWEDRRPSWFPREFDWVVGCSYLGLPTMQASVRNLLGANMSFRRGLLQEMGGFRDGIGRTKGKRLLGCEETELCIRIKQARPDSDLMLNTGAIVYHSVPRPRARFSYLISRCFAEGVSKAQLSSIVGRGAGLSSEREYVTRTLPRGLLQGALDLLTGHPSGLLRAGAIVCGLGVTVAGYTVGSVRGWGGPGRAFQR
jgi:glucosyl-dolichyl phosphate glucuronosyltransferase